MYNNIVGWVSQLNAEVYLLERKGSKIENPLQK